MGLSWSWYRDGPACLFASEFPRQSWTMDSCGSGHTGLDAQEVDVTMPKQRKRIRRMIHARRAVVRRWRQQRIDYEERRRKPRTLVLG
jgi:hypothetical protein